MYYVLLLRFPVGVAEEDCVCEPILAAGDSSFRACVGAEYAQA